MRRRLVIRLLFVALVVPSGAFFFSGPIMAGSDDVVTASDEERFAGNEPIAEPRDGVTVVATQAVFGKGTGGLVALRPNGSVLYFNNSLTTYFDVDPSPLGRYTVTYVAANKVAWSECGLASNGNGACMRNVVERVNLSTGEVERIYSRTTLKRPRNPLVPGGLEPHAMKIHDVDMLSPTRMLVADIREDSVAVVNVTADIETWRWNAQSAYPVTGGGPFPRDWTHLNDVEAVGNGTYMVSLRNQDQVVFVDRQQGLLDERTLGAEDNHSILYEQHNPDYIPESEGGPAVVVADSENNRVVEYQRDGSGWKRTWGYTDDQMSWPRDADRLPDGHTLIADSLGGRVMEVDEEGEVVWQFDIAVAYDAERLDTGDESAGGPSAAAAGLASQLPEATDEVREKTDGESLVGAPLPSRWITVIKFATPLWFTVERVVALAVFCLGALAWGAVELRWSRYTLDVRWPVRLRRE